MAEAEKEKAAAEGQEVELSLLDQIVEEARPAEESARKRAKDMIGSFIKRRLDLKPGASEVKNMATQHGLRTLMQDGISKVFRGQLDFKQVRAVALA